MRKYFALIVLTTASAVVSSGLSQAALDHRQMDQMRSSFRSGEATSPQIKVRARRVETDRSIS
jgi:hypothetical protein